MLILGIESSCDETGVALYDTDKGLIADALHTQIEMHRLYGGVVPELASRDHIRRIIPLLNEVMKKAGKMPQAVAQLRAKGITCLAAALYQSQPLSAAQSGCPGGVCVVIGSEGQGLTDETIAACTSTVRIPMTDRVESLNAGIAGSILLWHFREESL